MGYTHEYRCDCGNGTNMHVCEACLLEYWQAEKELAQLRDQSAREHRAWEAMETAPRDGTEVVLAVERRAGIPGRMLVGHYMPGGYCIEDHPPIAEGWYFWNGRMFDKAAKPIAWMPLPAPVDAVLAADEASEKGGES